MDLDDPPAEGDVIDPGTMVYKVRTIVHLAAETSPGVIEVERVAGPGQYVP
jgi:hypothetical protein